MSRKRPQDMTPAEFTAAFPGHGDRWKPWSEMSYEERLARVGDFDRDAARRAYEDSLINRLLNGGSMGRADKREARRLLKERA